MRSRKLALERVEERNLMAGDVFVSDGTLFVDGTNGNDFVQVDQVRGTNTVSVNLNGEKSTFDGVSNISVTVGNGDDEVSINTFDDPNFLISSRVFGGNGDDVLQGGGGSDYLNGGKGDDIVSNFVTDENYAPVGRGSKDVLIGGNGDDSLWGGWGLKDTILGGLGNDTIYDIVGGTNFIDGEAGDDFIIARDGAGLPTDPLNNPGGLVSDNVVLNKRDSSVVLFDAATQAGGQPVLIGNTLYVLNLDGGDIAVNQVGNKVVVTYDGQDFSFDADGITAVAGIGGATNDSFVNNTNIKSVFYGQGGSDVLLGGSNDDVLKGGNGDDYLDGRDGKDDITGDAGSDLLVAADGLSDIVRVDDLDRFFVDLSLDRLVVKRNLAFS
jgi:Ca2+-binding RTX toxin-like protein